MANNYVQRYNRNEEVRFDIIAILMNNSQTEITHIEGAFSTIM